MVVALPIYICHCGSAAFYKDHISVENVSLRFVQAYTFFLQSLEHNTHFSSQIISPSGHDDRISTLWKVWALLQKMRQFTLDCGHIFIFGKCSGFNSAAFWLSCLVVRVILDIKIFSWRRLVQIWMNFWKYKCSTTVIWMQSSCLSLWTAQSSHLNISVCGNVLKALYTFNLKGYFRF